MGNTSITNSLIYAYRLTKAQPINVRRAVLNSVYQRNIVVAKPYAEKKLTGDAGVQAKNSKATPNPNTVGGISDDVLRDAFNLTVEKIFEALSPSAFVNEEATLAAAFTSKFDSVKQFHEQGLFTKEFLYRVRKNIKQGEK